MFFMALRRRTTFVRSSSTMNEVIRANQIPIQVIPVPSKTIVKTRPSGVRGMTSEYPTAVKVMNVI